MLYRMHLTKLSRRLQERAAQGLRDEVGGKKRAESQTARPTLGVNTYVARL